MAYRIIANGAAARQLNSRDGFKDLAAEMSDLQQSITPEVWERLEAREQSEIIRRALVVTLKASELIFHERFEEGT
jgi:hypothetical protein